MNVLKVTKDGGPLSRVWAYWLFEIKRLASVALLRFDDGTRDAFHSHAFSAVSWVLSGELVEESLGGLTRQHLPSLLPIYTPWYQTHRVRSKGRSWVLTFRGPWQGQWYEWADGQLVKLTHGRKEAK